MPKFKVSNKPAREVKAKKNPLAMGNEQGFAAFYGQKPVHTTLDLLRNLGMVEPGIVNNIMAGVNDPDILRYDKYLPPGMYRNLGDDFGYNTDPKLKDYYDKISEGKFDYYLENPWIPDKTPHPFAGQPRPPDQFDKFADITYANYGSREEYIEGARKQIYEQRFPEHDPFKRNLSHLGL